MNRRPWGTAARVAPNVTANRGRGVAGWSIEAPAEPES